MSKATTKKPAVKEQQYPSFSPTLTLAEITDNFISRMKQGKKQTGDNCHLDDFALAARMLAANYSNQSFNFNNVLELTRHLDTPSSALVPIFHLWLDELKAHGRLKALNSCYDFPCWTFF